MNFAIADLHGNYELWAAIRDSLKPEDKLFVLGDSIDRGPSGIKILQEALFHPQVEYLMGNHEEFLLEWAEHKNFTNASLWGENGGYPTLKAFLVLPLKEQHKICNRIAELHRCYVHKTKDKDVWLCHSGFNIEDFLEGNPINMLWERDLNDSWNYEEYEDTFNFHPEKMYIIHGHTPVGALAYSLKMIDPSMSSKELEDLILHVLCYAGGRKIDIDLCTFKSNIAAMINIDTFECTYFERRDDKSVIIRESNSPVVIRKASAT